MRWVLLLLIVVLVGSDIFSLDLSLAPGLSVKNAMLYLCAMLLFFRTVLSGGFRLELPRVHALFGLWIGYALASCLVAGLIIRYSDYHIVPAVIDLKSLLVDSVLLCLTVFHGLRTEQDVRIIVKGLVAATCVANVLTLTDVMGLTHVGIHIGEGGVEEGRVFGVFGHANDTGTFIACMLPVMTAVAVSACGFARWLWYGGTCVSAVVLILTVSRGAFVALFAGLVIGAWMCRRLLPLSRLVPAAVWVCLAIVAAIGLAFLVYPELPGILSDRVLGQSQSLDLSELSSGRTSVWLHAVDVMMDEPVTLLTGYGWDVYSTMPFALVTHNYYLDLWFDLGLPGLVAFVLILRYLVVETLRAAGGASGWLHNFLVSGVFYLLILVVGIFFVNFARPWTYVWMLIGAIMRAMLLARAAPELAVQSKPTSVAAGRAGTLLAHR